MYKMKKLIWILPLSLVSLTFTQPSDARDITVQFPKGSSCASYGGRVRVGDNFVLNLSKQQQLIVKKTTPHDYSVIAPNGQYLEVIRNLSDEENQYWTGNQSGNFKVKVGSVPNGLQINIQFCAYSGEGAL
jgi:hypothetical protein